MNWSQWQETKSHEQWWFTKLYLPARPWEPDKESSKRVKKFKVCILWDTLRHHDRETIKQFNIMMSPFCIRWAYELVRTVWSTKENSDSLITQLSGKKFSWSQTPNSESANIILMGFSTTDPKSKGDNHLFSLSIVYRYYQPCTDQYFSRTYRDLIMKLSRFLWSRCDFTWVFVPHIYARISDLAFTLWHCIPLNAIYVPQQIFMLGLR